MSEQRKGLTEAELTLYVGELNLQLQIAGKEIRLRDAQIEQLRAELSEARKGQAQQSGGART